MPPIAVTLGWQETFGCQSGRASTGPAVGDASGCTHQQSGRLPAWITKSGIHLPEVCPGSQLRRPTSCCPISQASQLSSARTSRCQADRRHVRHAAPQRWRMHSGISSMASAAKRSTRSCGERATPWRTPTYVRTVPPDGSKGPSRTRSHGFGPGGPNTCRGPSCPRSGGPGCSREWEVVDQVKRSSWHRPVSTPGTLDTSGSGGRTPK